MQKLSSILLFICTGIALPERSGAEVPDEATAARDHFWAEVGNLCGFAYRGSTVTDDVPASGEQDLILHVRRCSDAEIRMPLQIGEDRSRTLVLQRTLTALSLRHDRHRADGTTEEISGCGGQSVGTGGIWHQDFAADRWTVGIRPELATNVWTLEFTRGKTFAYESRRARSADRLRCEFDLSRPMSMDLIA